MRLARYLVMPVGVAVVAVIYWFLSHEAAGTVMLLVFALAMGIMSRILIPTLDDVGPTAPIDPDWQEGAARDDERPTKARDRAPSG